MIGLENGKMVPEKMAPEKMAPENMAPKKMAPQIGLIRKKWHRKGYLENADTDMQALTLSLFH